jgi:hypothetical protein
LQRSSMAALTLRGSALPPVAIGQLPPRALDFLPCPNAEDAAVEHALYGSSSDEEEGGQRSTLIARETTSCRIAAATPRAAAEGPAGGAMSEDSSQLGAAGEASLSHHLDRTPARGDKVGLVQFVQLHWCPEALVGLSW